MELHKYIRNEKNTIGATVKTTWGQKNVNTFTRAGQTWLPPTIYTAVDALDAVNSINSKEFVITHIRWSLHVRNTGSTSMPISSYIGRYRNYNPTIDFPSNAFDGGRLVKQNTNATVSTANGYQVAFGSNRYLIEEPKYDVYKVHEEVLSRAAANGGDTDHALYTMENSVECRVAIKDASFTAGAELEFETDTFGECPFLALAAWTNSLADTTSNAAIICQYWYYEPPGVEKLFTI